MCIINKRSLLLLSLFSSLIVSAQSAKENAIKEITKAEHDFSAMAAEKGIEAAFVYFAAPNAIIKRGNDSIIFGNSGIANFYAKDIFKKAQLKWSPDFTDASESGDMGYTFGKYTWQLKDDQGKIIQDAKGIFHTVWKKQKDGAWKFVWD